MNKVTLLKGDCLQKLKELEDNSVDSVVTDPPYHLTSIVKRFGKEDSAKAQYGTDGAFQRASKGFMGKEWDGLGEDGIGIANNPELWKEVLRVLKPGGHLLSFSHSRTYHRQAVAVEDAGFEIRDQIMWIYGSGFPKSHNIGKAVDKLQGNEREVVGKKTGGAHDTTNPNAGFGHGKYANSNREGSNSVKNKTDNLSIITKGNSPYEGWGTALKPAHEPIVMARKPFKGSVAKNVLEWGTGGINIDECRIGSEEREGRFPANFIHDGIEEDWARYFYCPKASKKDRNEGCDELEEKGYSINQAHNSKTLEERYALTSKNNHPTVKPTDLMAYLVRLVTPKGGTVLDPFMGSGSTGKASVREGMDFIGIEREDEYMEIAKTRIEHEEKKHKHREFFN